MKLIEFVFVCANAVSESPLCSLTQLMAIMMVMVRVREERSNFVRVKCSHPKVVIISPTIQMQSRKDN